MEFRPQPGPQEMFLRSKADIAIYGGAAGGGKSFALLLEQLYHCDNPLFSSVVFRRTSPQITNEGALWDQASRIYPSIGAVPRVGDLEYRFPSGATVRFSHLQHEATKLEWQGSEIPLICFDELTHFTRTQFLYLMSRNRTLIGIKPYMRASTNPDADSWVAEFIAWWIDQVTGYPIPERAGVLRWFAVINDQMEWGDTREALIARYPECEPKSLTFIPAKLSDNAILMKADPGYRANLMAQPAVERARLLDGNWKIRPAAGLYFQRRWCQVVDVAPLGMKMVRGWDLAATPATGSNDPDWTVGAKMGRAPDGSLCVLDCAWLRGTPSEVDRIILNTASQDGKGCEISLPQDPGQAGKSQALSHTRMLQGYRVEATPETRNPGGENATPSRQSAKVTRFGPFSSQAQAGHVTVLRGAWNERWFDDLEAFPEARHDDTADATARAFAKLIAPPAPAKFVQLNHMGR